MHHRPAIVGAALVLVAAFAFPTLAQSEGPSIGEVVEVEGVEYAYLGLPTSVPLGTSLGLTNAGDEVHDLWLARIADGVPEDLETILNMDNPVGDGIIEIMGDPLRAAPGETAEGTLLLDREGRYAVVCFLPVGLTDIGVLEQLDSGVDPATLPADVQDILDNTFHAAVGMKQEFVVTGPGSTPGPLPPPAASTTTDDDGSTESAAP